MELELITALLTIFPKELAPQIVIYGFIYFMLIFYGAKNWENYSAFEKFVFPVLIGGVVYYLLILPITVFLIILKVFQNELTIINVQSYPYIQILFNLLLIYLATWRLMLSNVSLKDNYNFFNVTKHLIISIISFIFIIEGILLLAFSFSDYNDFLRFITVSMIFSFFLLLLYVVLLEFYGQKAFLTPSEIDDFFIHLKSTSGKLKDIISKNKTNINRALFIILIVVFIAAPMSGTYLLKTNVQLVEEKPDMLVVGDFFINRQYNNLVGDFYVWQNYSVEFRLIPWVKFKPNITLENRYGKNTNSKYNLSGDKLLIKNTSWNTIYVNLAGKKERHNIPKFYTLDIDDSNETFPKWNIYFENPYPYGILINFIIVEKGNKLDFINYEKSNGLNIKLSEPNDKEIIIQNVFLLGCDERLCENESISLYFEKNNTLT